MKCGINDVARTEHIGLVKILKEILERDYPDLVRDKSIDFHFLVGADGYHIKTDEIENNTDLVFITEPTVSMRNDINAVIEILTHELSHVLCKHSSIRRKLQKDGTYKNKGISKQQWDKQEREADKLQSELTKKVLNEMEAKD